MNKYKWKYGENSCQKYYEASIEGDYLCVFANNWNPNVWLGSYTKQGKGTITIGDKTFNDRQKKKDPKNKTTIYNNLNIPTSFRVLSNDNPEYMKKKVIWAYEHNLFEISR